VRRLAPSGYRRLLLDRLLVHDGNLHDKACAASWSSAVRGDLTALKLDQALRDRQPEAEATRRDGVAFLHERLEQPVHGLRLDAGTVVLDLDGDIARAVPGLNAQPPTGRRELDGVLQEIRENLPEPERVDLRVVEARAELHVEVVALRLQLGSQCVYGVSRDRVNVGNAELDVHLVSHDPIHVEEIVDEPRLGGDVAFDHLERLADRTRQCSSAEG
jgi:hypothetical protein